jgi:hypothetical protein
VIPINKLRKYTKERSDVWRVFFDTFFILKKRLGLKYLNNNKCLQNVSVQKKALIRVDVQIVSV